MNIETDSSDDENFSYLVATGILPGFEEVNKTMRVKSMLGKRANIDRQFDERYTRLLHDYITVDAKYGNLSFERRFRMTRHVFNRIWVTIHFNYSL